VDINADDFGALWISPEMCPEYKAVVEDRILGLARAASVMRILTQDDRLKEYIVLPLSAGQLINVGDKVTAGGGGDDKERRRIEIRLRRSNLEGILAMDTSGRDSRR
jgi:hypothetical protein